ncbi:MAG: hypothetical protein JXQ72_03630 [Anaerolineae bacterium]|nr:hypothetical protein [Anaerolineae bacterium]
MRLVALLVVGVMVLAVGGVHAQTGTPPPGGILLFEDDFATYSRRWEEKRSPKAAVRYQDDTLNARIVSPGAFAWSVPDFDAPLVDYSFQVEVVFLDGSTDSWAGIVLGYTDQDRFFALVVDPAGAWRWLQHDAGEWLDLTPEDAEPVERDPGEPLLRLRVDIRGDQLTVWIDDLESGLVMVEPESVRGTFGLIAQAGHGYVEVAFDNVMVTSLTGARDS